MKRIKTTVTYKVPDWEFCNCSVHGKDMCRFCVKRGKAYVCVLHNMPLEVTEGVLVKKDYACSRATAGFVSEVEDGVHVDPKAVIKATIDEYKKIYHSLIKQGYSEVIAEKLAQQTLGGK